jgi:hypothetical protein
MRYDVHYRQDLEKFYELEGISPQDRVCLVDNNGNEMERYFVKSMLNGRLYLDSEPDSNWKACRMWPR